MVEVAEIQMFRPGPIIGLIVTGPHGRDDKKMIESNKYYKQQCVVFKFSILRSQKYHPKRTTQLISQPISRVKNRLHYLADLEIMEKIFFIT